jgi:hypothetical protein
VRERRARLRQFFVFALKTLRNTASTIHHFHYCKMPPSLTTTPHVTLFLRKATVFVYPPAFILCLVHGIVAECAVPALGLIPLFFSSLLGAFLMYRDKIAFGGSPISLTRAQICTSDLAIAGSLLLILILSWIIMPNDYSHARVVLGTYATVPLMMNW